MSLEQLHQYLLYFLFGFSLVFFTASFFYTTPYGRFKTKPGKWDFPPLPGWLLLESPCLFAAALTFILAGGNNKALVPLILICIWQSHYFYRSVIFPLRVNKGSKAVSFSGIAFGIVFNSINGFLNGYAFSHAEHLLNPEWLYSANFIIGISLMAIGLSINIHSDNILKNLRKPGESGYKIPKGGFYRWVSAPNYFGEIIEWTGLALAAFTPASLAFLCFTIANLFPRALSHHRWYQKTFNDYPEDRKAIIPFVI